MFELCGFLQVSVEEAAQRFMGEEASQTDPMTPEAAGGSVAVTEAMIEKVARYVLSANEQYGDPQSSAQLASTIAKFCTDFQGDTADFAAFERQLEDAIRTAVRYTPKPSVGSDEA